jgi:hypothetical protein
MKRLPLNTALKPEWKCRRKNAEVVNGAMTFNFALVELRCDRQL